MDLKLERIEIVSFGKLSDLTMTFEDGINLLSAPNESGKSTVCAFLRFVLYGFADGRKQSLAENDKKLYTPWDQPRSEGSLLLKKGGTSYRIFRSSTGTKEELTVTDASTGKPLAIKEPGKTLLGVSEEVFTRTLFFRQSVPAKLQDGVLADQLQCLAVSEEEQLGSAKAEDALTKARNLLRGRAGAGILPKLEAEKYRLEAELSEANEDSHTLASLRAEVKASALKAEENRAKREEISAEKDALARFEAAQTVKKLRALRKEADEAKQAYEDASAEIGRHGEDDASFLASLLSENATLRLTEEKKKEIDAKLENTENALRSHENDLSVQDAVKAESKLHSLMVLSALCLFLALAGGIAAFFAPDGLFVPLLCISALCLVCSVVFFLIRKKLPAKYGYATINELKAGIRVADENEVEKKRILSSVSAAKSEAEALAKKEKDLRDSIENGIRSYRAEPGTDYDTQLQELLSCCNKLTTLQVQSESAERAYRSAAAGLDLASLTALAENAPETVRDRRTVEFEESFYRKQGEAFAEKKQQAELKLASLEARAADPAILAGKLKNIDEKLADYKRKYDAYEAARAGIEAAADRMKSMVAPRISKLSGSYFDHATSGKYKTLEVDTRLSMNTSSDGPAKDLDYLSAGTKDSAYLSLRLALADLLFGGNGMFLVLDDAFVRLDDERLASALSLLSETASRHQILLFTCTGREETTLKNLNKPYHTLRLKG